LLTISDPCSNIGVDINLSRLIVEKAIWNTDLLITSHIYSVVYSTTMMNNLFLHFKGVFFLLLNFTLSNYIAREISLQTMLPG